MGCCTQLIGLLVIGMDHARSERTCIFEGALGVLVGTRVCEWFHLQLVYRGTSTAHSL